MLPGVEPLPNKPLVVLYFTDSRAGGAALLLIAAHAVLKADRANTKQPVVSQLCSSTRKDRWLVSKVYTVERFSPGKKESRACRLAVEAAAAAASIRPQRWR
jgi:hypothetical protein